MNLRRVAIADLVPDPANARAHPTENIEAIRRSIDRWGQVEPLVVQRGTNRLVAGHGRLEVMRARGDVEADVVEVDVPEAEVPALALALNRTGELAAWNDEAPEPPEIPVTRPGDLWTLGGHRLLCGDSTKAEDVERLMDGSRAAVMQTDPPYGIAYDSAQLHDNRTEYAPIRTDELSDEKLQEFLGSVFGAATRALRENAAWYLWHAMLSQGFFAAAAAAAAANVVLHRQIVWVKPQLIFGRGDYHWKHELCFYGWRKGHRPPFYGTRDQTSVWEVGYAEGRNDRIHPTQKPVALFVSPIQNHTTAGEMCYEPFSGSGSQIIAAEQLERRCYAMEIEPRYVDVAVARWERLTGKKANRLTA